MIKSFLFSIICFFLQNLVIAQKAYPPFKELLNEQTNELLPFAISNNPSSLTFCLNSKEISVKQISKNWIFVQATPKWIETAQTDKKITQFHMERSFPVVLNDSSLVNHSVNQVHEGLGLDASYTGANVIVGIVDQGLDFTHGDFIDSNGNSRVLFYWDHSLSADATAPMPYGYGRLCTNAQIQAGTCGSTENTTAHGTSVAGAAVSNGLDNGFQKGVAPDANIIVVETNFGLPNWTLTIADACDFIFKKADELGMPAVVNLSLGSLLGSHDGDDPASELMEQLVDEKGGRIIVGAAGNYGNSGKVHVRANVDSDSSFVWMRPNPTHQLGANRVYMDLWTDLTDATWEYTYGANLGTGSFQQRAMGLFRPANFGSGSVIYDTLYNGLNRIATIEAYPEIIGGLVHIEILFTNCDSTSYFYSLITKGTGMFDAWTGGVSPFNLTDMVSTSLPSTAVLPAIAHYNAPDANQTIVSSWNCSEKIVSVGNLRNRLNHLDKNGNTYTPAPSYTTLVGELSLNSSKGPSRKNITKPDVSANGDVSLSAGPSWMLSNAAYNSAIGIDGRHVRNGGTSMASPLVAGTAALYLEKCPKGTAEEFILLLHSSSFSDGFTGLVPNNAYGFGKLDAHELMLASNFQASLNASSIMCEGDSVGIVSNSTIDSVIWMNNSNDLNLLIENGESYHAQIYNQYGCKTNTDTISITTFPAPPVPVISVSVLTLSTDSLYAIQWYADNVPLFGANNGDYTPSSSSNINYQVSYSIPGTGCEVFSSVFNFSADLDDFISDDISVFPNPTEGIIKFNTIENLEQIEVFDVNGKLVMVEKNQDYIDLTLLSNGLYTLSLKSLLTTSHTKIIKK